MSNLTKLEFVALDVSSNNYLFWVLDTEIHLDATNLRNAIKKSCLAQLNLFSTQLKFVSTHLKHFQPN